MIASERAARITQMVNEKGFMSTSSLASLLHVTESTIRRDCEELEKQGLLIRVHGGAKSLNPSAILSTQDEKKMSERDAHADEKEAVAKRAASFVRDGDCIYLDGGTSIVPMLKYLKGKKLKIVTNSFLIANQFDDDRDSELIVVGGKYIPEYEMSTGPLALSTLEKFNFDQAFLSCAGIDPETRAVYTAELDTMYVKEKAMGKAVKKYLLADPSKLHVKGFCSFIDSDSFDGVLVTEENTLADETLPENYIVVERPGSPEKGDIGENL